MLRPAPARPCRTRHHAVLAPLALAALALAGCQDAPSPLEPRAQALVASGVAGTQGRIAYASLRNTRFSLDIYVLDVAKGSSKRLTRNRGSDDNPAWSPDGQQIAFDNNGNLSTGRQVYVMPAAGGDVRAVTNSADHGANNFEPSWSPDGTRLLYTSALPGNSDSDIYVVPADGSGPAVNLTNEPTAYDYDPAWAPDAAGGVKFAFTSSRGGGTFVWIYDDSKVPALTQLTAAGSDAMPAWSPDGTKIAYSTKIDGYWDVFVVNADGTGSPTNLTNTAAAHDTDPRWSPDGSKIAFVSSRDGNNELYLMNADGTALRRLTANTVHDLRPAWQP